MKNRWIILAAGIVIQTILGGIYAWSIFVPELIEGYGLSKGQCGTVFGVCIGVFTVAMIFGGRLLTRNGPRVPALIGSVLFSAGYLLASVSGGRFVVLLLGIGVLSGAGIGFGYVCPLTVGMQWFPKRKGLITGVAVAGFGGGAILLSSVAVSLMGHGMDVLTLFRWIGLVAGALLVASSLLLDVPGSVRRAETVRSVRTDLLSTPFLVCLLGMFVGTFSGLLVIGNLTPIVRGAGLSVELAATAVSVFAAGNAAGRILWGFLFDRIRYVAIPASLVFFGLVLVMVCVSSQPLVLLLCSALLGFGFGANFVIYASALSSHFAVDLFPRLYPVCFLGYGLAGLTGPGMGGFLADATGSYDTALYLSIAMVAAAAVMTACGVKAFGGGRLGKEFTVVESAE